MGYSLADIINDQLPDKIYIRRQIYTHTRTCMLFDRPDGRSCILNETSCHDRCQNDMAEFTIDTVSWTATGVFTSYMLVILVDKQAWEDLCARLAQQIKEQYEDYLRGSRSKSDLGPA